MTSRVSTTFSSSAMPASAKRMRRWALEVEWLGDHTDCENAKLTRGVGDNGRCPGAGTAAHAGSNEHHVCAGQMIADRIDCLFGCGASHFGLRAGAQASGYLGAHLDNALGLRHGKRLCVGIGDDEVDALQPGLDHVVDGIAASAADPKHDNTRLHLADIADVGHFCLRQAWNKSTRTATY